MSIQTLGLSKNDMAQSPDFKLYMLQFDMNRICKNFLRIHGPEVENRCLQNLNTHKDNAKNLENITNCMKDAQDELRASHKLLQEKTTEITTLFEKRILVEKKCFQVSPTRQEFHTCVQATLNDLVKDGHALLEQYRVMQLPET